MSDQEIIDKVVALLSEIKSEPRKRRRIVGTLEDFLDSISANDKFWNSQAGQFLSEFKYNIAYYQPNKLIRLLSPGLFGDDKLLALVNQLLNNLKQR